MNTSDQDGGIGDFPLSNATDNLILMHRDVHFGGSFPIMLDYYAKEGKGVSPDFDVERIQALADMENQMQQNLAGVLLTGAEAEKVSRAKEAYKNLKELYRSDPKKNHYPILIANLLLSEEENPEKEIEAIVKEKGAIVPALIELVRASDFYDPLFPGYGKGPNLAAKCLGLIGDKRSIISLFEMIGQEDFFDEDIVMEALKSVGAPAKQFLLRVVHGRPLNVDNERAAIALITFKDDPEVSEACFQMLQDLEVRRHAPLATYLALSCEGLADPQSRKKFRELIKDPSIPKILRQDIEAIAHGWEA